MPKPKNREPFVSPCGKESHGVADAAECHNLSSRIIHYALKDDLPGQQLNGTKWDIRCEDLIEWKREHSTPNAAELGRVR